MNSKYLEISDEVKKVIKDNSPILAVDISAIVLNLPYPDNVNLIHTGLTEIKEYGVTPTLVYMLNGVIKIGVNEEDIDFLCQNKDNIAIVHKKDIALSVASLANGVLTPAAVISFMENVDIKVLVTSSIGGIYKYNGEIVDISSDIEALATSKVLVICAGIRPSFDMGQTLIELEARSIATIGFKTENLPCFFYSNTRYKLDYKIESPQAIALAFNMAEEIEASASMVVFNPITKGHELDKDELELATDRALTEAREKKLYGREYNNFMFKRLRELTGGASKNLFLYNANSCAQLAAWITFAMYKDKKTKKPSQSISNAITKVGKPLIGIEAVNEDTKIKATSGMDFYLWLFTVKRLAQTYDASKLIFNNFSSERQAALMEEYEKTYN